LELELAVKFRDEKAGRPCGSLVKNASQADLVNPLTHISPSRAGQQRGGAGLPANPQTKKKIVGNRGKLGNLN